MKKKNVEIGRISIWKWWKVFFEQRWGHRKVEDKRKGDWCYVGMLEENEEEASTACNFVLIFPQFRCIPIIRERGLTDSNLNRRTNIDLSQSLPSSLFHLSQVTSVLFVVSLFIATYSRASPWMIDSASCCDVFALANPFPILCFSSSTIGCWCCRSLQHRRRRRSIHFCDDF